MKRYHNDLVKSKQRQILKEIISATLLRYLKPKDIRVLCFPGVDGMEILEVYDQLGIPRQNITGLERDPHVAAQIRQKVPGITIPHDGSLETYIDNTQIINQNVISLDFTQNLSMDTLHLATKTGRSAQSNGIVYHIAFQRQREGAKTQSSLRLMTEDDDNALKLSMELLSAPDKEIPDRLSERGIEGHRENALRQLWMNCMSRSKLEHFANAVKKVWGAEFEPYIQYVAKDFFERVEAALTPDELQLFRSKKKELMQEPSRVKLINLMTQMVLPHTNARVKEIMIPQFYAHGYHKINISEKQMHGVCGAILTTLMEVHKSSHYELRKLSKYAYVSETGTAMMGDVGYLHSVRSIAQAHAALAQQLDGNLQIRDPAQFIKAHNELARVGKVYSESVSIEKYPDLERLYLGSSAKPILSSKQIRERLLNGQTPAEIKAETRGKSIYQITAIQSHIKMGTYNERKISRDLESENELRIDLETRLAFSEEGVKTEDKDTINRDDCLFFLSEGYAPAEIHAAYPDTSLPRIHSWDHHRKRRQYLLEVRELEAV